MYLIVKNIRKKVLFALHSNLLMRGLFFVWELLFVHKYEAATVQLFVHKYEAAFILQAAACHGLNLIVQLGSAGIRLRYSKLSKK